ncbi:MAG: hypothetical protein M0R77_07610 [Gammaproteobacteria bacterium]|nr:hypothetical protein [Gammaproteobacteria bacterium]
MEEITAKDTLETFVEYMAIVRDVLAVSLERQDMEAVVEITDGLTNVLDTFLEGDDIA